MPSNSSAAPRLFMWIVILALAAFTVSTLMRAGAFTPPPTIALVASDESMYWDDAILGARHAAKQYNAELTVHQAKGGEPDQSRILRELAAQGVDGIAVSPLHAQKQAAMLLDIGRSTNVVTFDSDSPLSERLCFVGTDNYAAGRACGTLVRRAMPDGGTVVIAVGSTDKDNGRLRRQGVIDELLERTFDPSRPADPMDAELSGPEYTIVRTLVDDNDPEQAERNVDGLLAASETPGAIVGLYAYSGPAAVRAIETAGMTGQIAVIGFDYTDDTLEAIESGQIFASMAQDPYYYGFHAVRVLVDELSDDIVGSTPINGILELPCFPITANNLESFKADLAERRSEASG